MNAITVNYAEIDSNSVPRSFGLAYTSLLINGGFFVNGVSHIFNASVKKLTGTPYSLVQGRNFDYDKDIIVTTASPSSTSLNALRGVENQTWINFHQPEWDNDSFIWLDYNPETGKFYTIIEKDTFPDEKELGYSVQVSRVLENVDDCYNQVALTTKAALNSTADANTVTVKHNGLILFTLDSTLKVLKESANDDNFVILSSNIADSYQVDEYASYIDPALTVWAHEGAKVTPGIELVSSSGVVKKYAESVSGDQHLYQVLTGNNEVKFYRKRAQLTVHFTFNGDASSFEAAGAYCSNIEDSYMDGNNLIVPQVKYGRTTGSLLNFIANADETWFNSTALLSSEFKGAVTENRTITIHMPDIKDKIMFTGWYGNGVVSNQEVIKQHQTLKTTYELASINNNYLSNIAVTENGGLLTWDGNGSKTFTRHRQLHYIHWKRNGDEWGFIDEDKFLKENKVIVDDTTTPKTYDTKGAIGPISVIDDRKRYTYASENSTSCTFYATAHYNNIPAAVSVTAPNNSAAASSNQVVLFRGNYYVANDDMKNLVKRLVPSATVTKKTVWEEEEDKPWTATYDQSFWYVTPNYKEVTETIDGAEATRQVFDGYNYDSRTAEITIKGTSNNVTNITSSDTHLSVQFGQAIKDSGNNLKVEYTCSVAPVAVGEQEGYSLSDQALTSTLGTDKLVPNETWNKKVTVTYKFFN